MRKLINQISFFAATVLICQMSWGQQDPQLTQYMYNMSLVNPAYSTANDGVMNLGALYRAQWVGINGAPTTATLFAHAPVSDRIELGVNLIHDEIGDVVKETNLNADFAYKLQLSTGSNLAFGLKAGAAFLILILQIYNWAAAAHLQTLPLTATSARPTQRLAWGCFILAINITWELLHLTSLILNILKNVRESAVLVRKPFIIFLRVVMFLILIRM